MLRKLVCFMVVLGMAGVAGATDWVGAEPGPWGPGGDGWDFNNADNWRDPPPAPANENPRILRRGSWRINDKTGLPYENYPEYDLDITVTASVTHYKPPEVLASVSIWDQPDGYRCDMTVNPGVDWRMNFHEILAAGSLTLKPDTYVRSYGWLILSDYMSPIQQTDITVTVEAGGYLRTAHLLHTHGMIDIHGEFRIGSVAWIQSHIGTNRFHVYPGGVLRVDSVVDPCLGWGGDQALTDARVTVFHGDLDLDDSDPNSGGRVQLIGDHTDINPDTGEPCYLTRVEGGGPEAENGTWLVDLNRENYPAWGRAGYTTVMFVLRTPPPPLCNPDNWADLDWDGDVDQDDFAMFQLCFSGDGQPYPPDLEYCQCADRDADGDVDADDFAAFTACATGPGIVGSPPGCSTP